LSSWQAIETAPKDGSDFIGMRRDGERLLTHTTRMALYSGHHLWECLEFDAVSPWSPTHWMPLPGIATVETTPARSEAIQRRADAVANSCKVCGFMFGDHAPACSAVNTKVVTCEHVPRGYACEFCNHDGGPL
jgi:hypothetical protein